MTNADFDYWIGNKLRGYMPEAAEEQIAKAEANGMIDAAQAANARAKLGLWGIKKVAVLQSASAAGTLSTETMQKALNKLYGSPQITNIGGVITTPINDLLAASGQQFGNYKGKRVRIINTDYQSGDAQIAWQEPTGPCTMTVRLCDLEIERPADGKNCTCGNDSLSEGKRGLHSSWCDKFFKY